jgi:hypothetical protein
MISISTSLVIITTVNIKRIGDHVANTEFFFFFLREHSTLLITYYQYK